MRHILFFLFIIISIQANTLEKVSLQLQWKYQFQFAGYILAKEKGFYKEKNLDVHIKEWHHGIHMVDEVINENSQFAVSRPTSLIDISKGKKIIYLATIYQSSPLVLLSDKSSGITSIKQFKDKKIMTTGDLNTDTSLISMMFSQGIDLDSLKVQAPSFNPKDLLDKKTDLMAAYISNEPFILKELGGEPVIFSPKDYGFNFYNDIIITSENYLKTNPKEVENFRKQTLKGWEYAFNNIEESVDIIYNKYNSQNKSKDALIYEAKKLKELAYFQTQKIGKIEKDKLEKIYDTYKLLGLVKNNIDFNKIIYKDAQYDMSLTKEEIDYLNNKEYLTVMSHDSFHPFSFRKSDGIPRGYSMDIIRLMGKSLNKEIRFIKKPWHEQFQMLVEGKLDIIPHMAITPERKKLIDYTNFQHATFRIGFATSKDKSIRSMADLKGKTLAVVNGYYLHKHLEKNFPDIKLYLAKSTEDAINSVVTGKADVVVDNIPTLNYFIEKQWLSNLKIFNIEDFGMPLKTEIYMAVRKGNTLLKSILEKTNASLPKDQITKIQKAWVGNNILENELSNEEEKFIEDKKKIKILVRANRPPFEFSQNNEAKGIAVDYLKEISKKTGLNIEFISKDISLKEAYDMLLKGTKEFDTMAFMVKNETRARDFAFGDSYLSYPMMIITYKDAPYVGKLSDLKGKKVAIEKSYLTNKWIKRDYPQIEIIEARDTTQALNMVNKEKADAYVGNMAVANYMIIHGDMDNLKIAAPTEYGNISYSFVAPKDLSILTSILSKGYAQITPKEHNLIQQKWFSMQTVEKINYELVWKISLAATLIIIWFIWWNRKLRNAKSEIELTKALLEEKNKELEKISNTDRLTNIHNRMSLEYILDHQFNISKRYQSQFAIIMIDIDHFKDVNDRYGHLIGDQVLIEFTNILAKNIRNTDFVGRWGGEEFIVVCPNTDLEGAKNLAISLKEEVENFTFTSAKSRTASFGATNFQNDDTIDDIIKRADDALCVAKDEGRNKVIAR